MVTGYTTVFIENMNLWSHTRLNAISTVILYRRKEKADGKSDILFSLLISEIYSRLLLIWKEDLAQKNERFSKLLLLPIETGFFLSWSFPPLVLN